MKQLRPIVTMLLLMTLITGVIYPLVVTGAAQLLFPAKANGSLIERDGHAVGSSLIGQPFTIIFHAQNVDHHVCGFRPAAADSAWACRPRPPRRARAS